MPVFPEHATAAIIAYYVNIILGLDYDSFSLRGGDDYFNKAWNIVTNAPEGRDISGWKPFDGIRNRYWLAENFQSNRFTLIHDIIYAYYRTGFDLLHDNEDAGRMGVVNSLNFFKYTECGKSEFNDHSFFLPG